MQGKIRVSSAIERKPNSVIEINQQLRVFLELAANDQAWRCAACQDKNFFPGGAA
jgi:hypothetical protein